ncbi:putative glycoside hydrolase [Miltoncostaea marina]|uniref:putative glycoside hydrolase n=1 Tax=Miltoncostaea marina TaxID=2843215 RepID=UPI001C3D617A|nr:putative glycoside hydrolase [Miltoncostaea marina]
MALGALAFGFLCGFAMRGSAPQLATVGPAEGAVLGPHATDDLRFRIESDVPDLMGTATLEYDGADVLDAAYVGDGVLTFRPEDLSEGPHRLEFSIDQPLVPWPARREWRFTIDHTRPRIEITGPDRPAVRGAPVVLSGRVNEPATVTVDGRPVEVAADGTFAHTFEEPPPGAIAVRAVDRAGNSRGLRTSIPLVTRRPIEGTRAVHMTAISWATPSLREPVLDMLRRGEINTIELDLKDESGIVGYDSELPFARRIGAVRPEYDLEEAVATIRALGGRVMGRVVAFRDPVHAAWAWDNGFRDQVVQTPSGDAYAGYGGFTNFAHPVVRDYNMDVAQEAAERGVEDILYDYIRRPDGPLDTMRFPGLRGGAQQSIVDFLGEVRERLEPSGTFLGASLFGIAAFRPEDVAQDVRRIARNVDYVAPLIYPSHWGAGAYDIDDPEASPKEIIAASVRHFNELMEGTGARQVPWLQDFSLRVPYEADEVCAQIEGARSQGVEEWIMWDAEVTYTRAACLRG